MPADRGEVVPTPDPEFISQPFGQYGGPCQTASSSFRGVNHAYDKSHESLCSLQATEGSRLPWAQDN